ncbi:MAG TPA: 2OG-Fe(II) oxygenase family protein [Kofleriaceae bacterium]
MVASQYILPLVAISRGDFCRGAPCERAELASRVVREFEDNRCLLVGDAIPRPVTRRFHALLRRLFALPAEEKLAYMATDPLDLGFGAYGSEHALDTGIANLLESWDVSLTAPTRWPATMLDDWAFLVELHEHLNRLVVDVLAALAVGLQVAPKELLTLLERRPGRIHLIHYPPMPDSVDTLARRQSKHCDMSIVTLLTPPTGPGLQACNADGRFLPVEIGEDQCLIQAGLYLERLTGDRLRASRHTVETPSTEENSERYASPLFFSPPPDEHVSVLRPFQSTTMLEKYPTLPAREISADYFKKLSGER